MYRRLIAAVAAAVVVFVTPIAAWADGGGDAFNDGTQVGADAGSSGVSGGEAGSGGGQSNCTYERLDAADVRDAEGLAKGDYGPQPGNGPGTWYRKICYDANGQSTGTLAWRPDPMVDPAVLAQEASDRTPIPV